MKIPETDIKIFYDDRPVYGQDYGRGWIGFNHAESWMSDAIARAEWFSRQTSVPISHVFIVSGENECVEAAYPKGVVRTKLDEGYFDRDDRYVVFRKPRGLDDEMADRIVKNAESQLGADFDNEALAENAVPNSMLEWLGVKSLREMGQQFVDVFGNGKDVNESEATSWVCSALAAHVLSKEEALADQEILHQPTQRVTPQMLFEAEGLFEPLK